MDGAEDPASKMDVGRPPVETSSATVAVVPGAMEANLKQSGQVVGMKANDPERRCPLKIPMRDWKFSHRNMIAYFKNSKMLLKLSFILITIKY